MQFRVMLLCRFSQCASFNVLSASCQRRRELCEVRKGVEKRKLKKKKDVCEKVKKREGERGRRSRDGSKRRQGDCEMRGRWKDI